MALILTFSAHPQEWALDYLGAEEKPKGIGTENYCGAYSVWYALRLFAEEKSLAEVADSLNITENGCTIQSIVNTLNNNGLRTEAVALKGSEFSKLVHPAIVNRKREDNTDGHFVLFVPTSSGDAYILDGVRDSKVVANDALEAKQDETWFAVILTNVVTRDTMNKRYAEYGAIGGILVLLAMSFRKVNNPGPNSGEGTKIERKTS